MSEQERQGRDPGDVVGGPPAMPRWVKVTAIVVGVLVVVVLVLKLTGLAGQHGPGRHLSEERTVAVVELAAGRDARP